MRYITVLTVLGKEYTTKNSDISDIDLGCDIISVEYCNGKVVDINRDQIESIAKESGLNYIASPCKILDSINDELKYLEENINIDVACSRRFGTTSSIGARRSCTLRAGTSPACTGTARWPSSGSPPTRPCASSQTSQLPSDTPLRLAAT